MTRIFSFLFLSLFSIHCLAVNFSIPLEKENLLVNTDGHVHLELKSEILFQILDDIKKEIFLDTVGIAVTICRGGFRHQNPDYLLFPYALGYGMHNFHEIDPKTGWYSYNTFKPHGKYSILFESETDYFDIENCVKLIYYGLKHKTEVGQLQTNAKRNFGIEDLEKMKSLRPEMMIRIMNMKFPELDTFFKRRYYPFERPKVGWLMCYFQNGSYHFYTVKKDIDAKIFPLSGNIVDKMISNDFDTIFLRVDSLYWIYYKPPVNLVFSSPDNFYCIDVNSKTIIGPFITPYNIKEDEIDVGSTYQMEKNDDDTLRIYYDNYPDAYFKFHPRSQQFSLCASFARPYFEKKFIDDTTKFPFKNSQPTKNAYAGKSSPKLILAGVLFVVFILAIITIQARIRPISL